MSHGPGVWKLWQVLGAQFFVTIVLMKFVLKNPCQQQCIFSVAPCQRSYACPVAQCLHTAGNKVLGAQFFGTTALMEFVLKTRANSSASQYTSLPPNRALPKPFPTIYFPSTLSSLPYRSFPMELSSCYFPRFRSRHLTLSSLPYRSFPTELSPSYFPRFPFRPPCRRFHLVVSSPQAIPHDFLSVHPIVASIWLLPNGALPVLFPTVSRPSTSSSLPHRSFPTRALPKLFPTASLPSTLSSLPSGPSRRNSPQAISHGFPSVHLVVASISLLPHGFLAKLFPTLSLPSALSSLPSRSFPIVLTELSPCYFPRFPVRPPSSLPSRSFPTELFPSYFRFPFLVVASVLLLPNELSPCYLRGFPFRPPCFHLAPSPRSSPQAVFHSFLFRPPYIDASVSLLPDGALPKLFPMLSSPSTYMVASASLLPNGALPIYFPRFPAVHLVVASVPLLSNRALPMLFPRVSIPSVHLVVASVSLLPNGALPKIFPTVSLPSTLSSLPSTAPSPRSSPQSISDGFPFRHPVVASISLLPHGALPMLFPTVPLRPPCRRFHIASSQQSSPQAIPHGFPSVHIYGRFRIAPSQRNSPHAISPSLHPAVASVGKERCGSDDKVDGRETVGNSMGREGAIRKRRQGGRKGNLVGNSFGRAPLGRGDTEATTEWMEGKRWEITWGELRWEGAKWNRGK